MKPHRFGATGLIGYFMANESALVMDESPHELYQHGALALKQARYDDAIACFERFCQEAINRQSKQFFQAQMWLAQAYHKDQKDLHAIALCEQLTKSDIPQVKQWANQALSKLMEVPDDTVTAPNAPPIVPSHDLSEDMAAPVAEPEPINRIVPPAAAAISNLPRSAAEPIPRRPRPVKKAQPKDYTQQIMVAIGHGSISLLASIVLFLLFGDSVVANGLGIVRFAVPLAIFLTTDDAIVKANAREATNYALTCLVLFIPILMALFFLALIFAVAWPIGILLGLVLGAYLLTFSLYPVFATGLCITQADHVFHYPHWLVLPFLKE